MGAGADELYRQARRLLSAYRPAQAEPLLRRALLLLERAPGDPEVSLARQRVRLTMAYVTAELGRTAPALQVLDRLEGEVQPRGELRGLIALQRGLILWRSGRLREAVPQLDAAAVRLRDHPHELYPLLLNRGALQLALGRIESARADYQRCVQLASSAGDDVRQVKAGVSLAYLELVRGDLPHALAELDSLLARAPGGGPGVAAEIRLIRAEALFSAGLLAEADADLTVAAAGFAEVRMRRDQAECDLTRALVALIAQRLPDAVRLARRAGRRFARQESPAWALIAELVELQARLPRARQPHRLAVRADELSAGLRAAGLQDDARVAALVAVRGLLRAGDLPAAAAALAAAPRSRRHAERITTRMQARSVRAELATARGDLAAADAERRRGLRELHSYQSTFGSLDLQTAVAGHGRELAETGLAAAVRAGRPGRVFAWAERGRALASRLPPVRPPADPQAARLLQELRLVRHQAREAELSGRDDAALRVRRRDLERQVRARSWHAPGPGEVERPAALRDVRAALTATDGPAGTLVAHLVSGAQMHALAVTPTGARLLPLAGRTRVAEAARRVRADLDVLALTGYPDAMRDTVTASLRHGLGTLAELLWRPVHEGVRGVDDGPVLLVPAGCLAGVPWPLLAGLAGRPVTVARSATAWLLARTGAVAAAGGTGRTVLVAGPDLNRAHQEVLRVAEVWPGASTVTGDRATGAALLEAAAGAHVLHVAAHGAFESANPLFSSVRMADGPVFGYELAGRLAAGAHVVLSCCDLGISMVRPGEEVLGMTAALLHAGASSVVASVARVSDATAGEVLVDYHRGLRGGLTPAAALAAALPDPVRGAGFVCFGSGW